MKLFFSLRTVHIPVSSSFSLFGKTKVLIDSYHPGKEGIFCAKTNPDSFMCESAHMMPELGIDQFHIVELFTYMKAICVSRICFHSLYEVLFWGVVMRFFACILLLTLYLLILLDPG